MDTSPPSLLALGTNYRAYIIDLKAIGLHEDLELKLTEIF